MCGIVGFIGKSTNPKITYSLVSSLLVKTEVRGKEATGVWAAQEGTDGKVLFHKEPVPSSQFVTRDIWKHLRSFDPTVLISHCREPSAHAGPPKVNRNNHPHVNETHTLAVVHNGKVEEYHQLKFKGYQKKLRGECDSELIRELFTIGDEFGDDNELYSSRYAGLDRNLGPRLLGIDRIFAKLKGGAMAVAVGERLEQSHRALWLWRDDKRPLWLVDLRPSLGQVFFCSTAQIWREAVDAAPDVKAFLPADHELYDFPSFHSYLFEIDPDQSDTPADPQHPDFQKNGWEGGWRLRKFKVVRTTKDGEEPELKPKADAQQRPPLRVSVVTMLADNEDVLDHQVIRHPGHEPEELEPTAAADTQIEDATPVTVAETAASTNVTVTVTDDNETELTLTPEKGDDEDDDFDNSRFDMTRLSELESSIKQKVEDIATAAQNMAMEGSIRASAFGELLNDLEQIESDLTGIKIANFSES